MTGFALVYRAILRLAPDRFRRRYGAEAAEVAIRRVRDQHGMRRISSAIREWIDALVTVAREWRADGAADPRRHASVRPGRAWDAIAMDARTAARRLRATPGFTAMALTILTLGIGASTAIFSVVDAVVLRGLPFDEGDRIVAVGRVSASSTRPAVETAQTFLDWRAQQDVFDGMAATAGAQFTVPGDAAAPPEVLHARRVTANLFALLRVAPAMGRGFAPDNEIEGRQHVAVISDGLWRRRFGCRPDVLTQTLTTESGVWQIVGVMPPGFTYPVSASVDVWVPFAPAAVDRSREHSGRTFAWSVIGRLQPHVTVGQAQARMTQITSALARDNPQWFREGEPIGVVPLRDAIVGGVRSWMTLLLSAVAIVLLIACVNVANLMLARATTREREVAVRAALGGTRWQLARGMLVESLLLSAIGTAMGVVIAAWGVEILKASMPQGIPRLSSIAIDLRVLIVAAVSSTVTGVMFGVAPALQGSRPDVAHALKEGGRSSTAGANRQRLRAALVIAEVTLAVMLLVGAGLFISSFVRFTRVDLGFDVRSVFTLDAYLDYRDPSWHSRGRPFVADILSRLRAIPGAEAAAVVDGLPLTGSWSRTPVALPGRPPVTDPDGVVRREISPGYFSVMRIPILRGRVFTDGDSEGAQPVIILSDAAARLYFPGESSLGRLITITPEKADRLVVGVVGATRMNGPETGVWPEAYEPISQADVGGADFVIRTSGPPEQVRPAAIAAIRAVRPEQVIAETQTMQGYFDVYAAQRKFTMQLLGLFGLLGIVIAGAGIYGVMAFLVAQRTHEIGIRMALGARPADVLAAVLSRAAAYVSTGLVLGFGAAWGLSRLVAGFLFEVPAHDVSVYATVAGLLMASGLIAAFIPARRAARVDPLVALRT